MQRHPIAYAVMPSQPGARDRALNRRGNAFAVSSRHDTPCPSRHLAAMMAAADVEWRANAAEGWETIDFWRGPRGFHRSAGDRRLRRLKPGPVSLVAAKLAYWLVKLPADVFT